MESTCKRFFWVNSALQFRQLFQNHIYFDLTAVTKDWHFIVWDYLTQNFWCTVCQSYLRLVDLATLSFNQQMVLVLDDLCDFLAGFNLNIQGLGTHE